MDATLSAMSLKPSDFVIPPTTSDVLLATSWQPLFVLSSTKFQRAAYYPTRMSLVTERIDPGDSPDVFNYNEYRIVATTGGTLLSDPFPTPTTFIPHHLSQPSTRLSSLRYFSTS